MSKRKNKKHVDVEATNVEVLENLKEETEMTEKKGIINGIKEFGNKLPKPVKVVGGVALGAAAVAGTVFAVVTKLNKDEDDNYIDCDFEDSDEADETATESETADEA